MVQLNKTPLPSDITIKSEVDYRSKPVYELLINDCYNKCYLCEDGSMPLDVEHLIPHGGDAALKYDWNNLLVACEYCNNTKNRKEFAQIINCIVDNPEDYLKITLIPKDGGLQDQYVEVVAITNNKTAIVTKNLLDLIYNGDNTPRRCFYSPKLRKKVLEEHNRFTKLLADYLIEPNQTYKNLYQQEIIDMINKSSIFAAIKRNVIRDTPNYFQEFGGYL